VARGLTNKEIGHRLGISERTVSTNLTIIFTKFGASNRVAAVEMARQQGLLAID
jgi:DNA-binding CsgD family transcriptional regulator